MPIETIEDAERFIKRWMNDRGYLMGELSPDGITFQLNGKFDTGVAFSIVHPKTLKRAFIVVAQIDIHPSHMKALKDMNPEDLNRFLGSLKRDLFFTIPTFTFIPHGASIPNAVQFNKQISFDELTEGKLYNNVEYTCRCVLWVAMALTGKFGQPVEGES
ncbi:MAG: hypothetical protein QG670_2885 [Thermoproteota archaeon]|nr:hypothetical protein [Thermoproteota archaeon]